MTTLFASHALLPSGPARDVLIEVAGAGLLADAIGDLWADS